MGMIQTDIFDALSMSTDSQVVCSIIRCRFGKQRAVSVEQIADMTGIPPRTVRDIVKHLIEHHQIRIGSSLGNPPGYYMIATKEEAEQNETELSEKAESVSGDIETLSEASEKLHSETARERLNEADRSAQEDMEFLNEHKQKLEQIRQESIDQQSRQEQRVNTHRRN